MTAKSIYLVLDMMNDLVHADGPNGKGPLGAQVQDRQVIQNTARALEKARAAGMLIGYVRVGFSSDYRECPPSSPIFSKARENGLFKLGTWGTEVHSELAPHAHDFDIVKHRVSPFYGTNLEPILRAHAIRHVYLGGVSSNAVVQATVRDAHDRDYECVVLEDCCASFSSEDHDQSMAAVSRFATLSTSRDVDFPNQ
ncbi:cysteine hydrolase family protein [Pollutimonas bauzanensis]|uniref:Nicotinamidase-related amidase n=1 Tax=Pollutimonas bauzanensis TaxID=658167 RepID=A0A1M5USA0_9BURK|nr:cysteine hydrolase [Pollutimonas bauzanensis]SHH65678.1 Nicotinamidase-related amidase [Pollutimonas bauzanensis]